MRSLLSQPFAQLAQPLWPQQQRHHHQHPPQQPHQQHPHARLLPALCGRRSEYDARLLCGRWRLVATRAWTQVMDAASGKPYYWNTATNETAWELPSAAAGDGSAASTPQPAAAGQPAAAAPHEQQQQQQQQQQPSNQALFDILEAAYAADGSGMHFWEVARAHRAHGVFEEPYMEWLAQQQKGAATPEARERAAKMMARLSNPLLRQPAPFEF